MQRTVLLNPAAQAGAALPAAASVRNPALVPPQHSRAGRRRQHARRAGLVVAAVAAPAAPGREGGHTALLHGLGEVGDVPAVHMPWLLRLAHIKSRITGGDSTVALQESARGLLMWKVRCSRPGPAREGRGEARCRLEPGARLHHCEHLWPTQAYFRVCWCRQAQSCLLVRRSHTLQHSTLRSATR